MSVIVKGMNIPNNCVDCEFGLYRFGIICQLRDYERNVPRKCIDDDIRPNWCPLIEIPKGARLIDGNKISSDMDDMKVEGETFVTAVNFVKLIVNDAPVIFEEDEQ